MKHSSSTASSDAQLLRRIGWRILPLLLLLYFVAYLDRINISFAAAAMQRDLHFSDALYGTGAGLYFVGTLIAQVPSNLLLYRIGARRMIAGLMVVWGGISGAMAFVHTPALFLVLRFLLGAAEAGFYPGVILYLTLWLPRRVRISFTAWFLFAIPLANILGGPLSTFILQRGATGRFTDWQTLLLTEAFPALILGSALPWLMTDSPATASWLPPSDRAHLAGMRQADEPNRQPATHNLTTRFAVGSLSHVLRYTAIYFAIQFALYAQGFWLPKILHNLGEPQGRIGWQVAAVYLIAGVGMAAWGKFADRAPSRRWTLSVPLPIAATAYASTSLAAHTKATLPALIVTFGLGAAGGLAATPAFWAQVTLGQKTAALAGRIAMINALGNLGGFAGPAVLGSVQQHTHSYVPGMLLASAGLLLAAAAVHNRGDKSHA